MNRVSGSVVVSIALLALGGCATSRSELKFSSPTPMAAVAKNPSKGAVFIRSINDRRTFEQAPSDPSTPSLGFEGATQAADTLKARAIGRKRNGFGKALGDVLLEDGQSVTAMVRDHLVVAFTEAGYKVENDAMAASLPLVLDVDVKQFWAWFEPGFWAITLNANIVTDIKVAGQMKPKTITVHTEDKRQAATEGAWMQIVEQGLKDFRAQVTAGNVQ
jgi:uncharacterized lipoprotein YajG